MISHKERIQTIMMGELPDRPAIALWRHFPIADRTLAGLVQATLQFQARYDWDFVKVTPRSSYCIQDWGARDIWLGHNVGKSNYHHYVIQSPDDWGRLPVLSSSMPALAEQLVCLRLIKQGLSPEVPLLATIFSPLAQAKNLAGNATLLNHLRDYPEKVIQGLTTIAKSTQLFVRELQKIGVDGIFYAVQHAQAEMLSWENYVQFGLEYDCMVLAAAEHLWCNVLHLHGNKPYFQLVKNLNLAIVNWHDQETTPLLSQAKTITDKVLCGGLNQASFLHETPAALLSEVRNALETTHGRRLILGAGCVIPYLAADRQMLEIRKSVEDNWG